MKRLAVLVLVLLSCNTADAMKPAPPLSLTTDGGFTGRGIGSVAIDKDAVKADQRCSGTLTAAERDELRKLSAAAKPESWKASYAKPDNPHGYADQVKYTLTFGSHEVSWYDEVENELPRDLAALRAAVWRVRDRVMKDCN